MFTGIAKKAFKGPGAFKIELNIVFRSDSHAAVKLNTATGIKEKRLAAVSFADTGRLSERLSITATGEKLVGNTGGVVEP